MNLFLKLLAVLKAGMPLPVFADVKAVLAWWNGLGPAAADLIAAMAVQFKVTGHVDFFLPDGSAVSIVEGADGRLEMSDDHQAMFCCAVAPGADGKWLLILKNLLPIILQILSVFFTVNPTPAPIPPVNS